MLLADLPETGLYTLSVFGVAGGGQRWMADGCRKSVVCPSPDAAAALARHPLRATSRRGRTSSRRASARARWSSASASSRRRTTPADYVATLERLGLELGTAGPITREKAEEARRFLDRRRAQQELELCGDILQPGTLVAELATGGPGGGGGGGGRRRAAGARRRRRGRRRRRTAAEAAALPPPVIPPLPPPSPILPDRFAGSD